MDTTDKTRNMFYPSSSDGKGNYSKTTYTHKDILYTIQPLVIKTLETFDDVDREKPFTICEYGAADGGTSIKLMTSIVEALRKKYGKDQPIQIFYEDLPTSDFKSLFLLLNGLLNDEGNYYSDGENVFIAAVGVTFYNQCLPSNSVHLGISSTAFHFLNNSIKMKHTIISRVGSSDAEFEIIKRHGAKDWETILLHRARELAPGGHLIMVLPGCDNQGFYVGKTEDTKKSVWVIFNQLWTEMLADKTITQLEFEDANIHLHWRTEEELRSPFTDNTGPVMMEGLTLQELSWHRTPCALLKIWKKCSNDAKNYAKLYVDSLKTWSFHAFDRALSPSRTEREKTLILEELYSRYEAIVESCPDEHSFDFIYVQMHMRKELR